MDFNVETKEMTKKRKKRIKKQKNKMVAYSMFFVLLTFLFIFIYIYQTNNKTYEEPKPIKKIPERKLKIVDENSNDRPIAIMIDNNIGELKHAGLQDSYINYEIIVEGGLTRIMALYKDIDVDLIGPVRSSRHYFLDYAMESDAIYVHYGWSPYAANDIKRYAVNNINGITSQMPFVRDQSYKAPHNVFTSLSKIKAHSKNKNYDLETDNWKLLNYSYDEIELNKQDNVSSKNGESSQNNSNVIQAEKISLDYSYYQNRSYIYDSENKYYLRSMNGVAHVDRELNKQLHYKNVIIQKVSNKTIDSEGRQDVESVGTGTGYYITNGYAKIINWTKNERSGKTTYKYQDGTEVKINDGNTFIQIVPINSKINIE